MENTEKLVGRIRWFMNLDLSLDEIVAKLTDEEKRIKILTLSGWMPNDNCNGTDSGWFSDDPIWKEYMKGGAPMLENTPDYLHDLNACHGMEKVLWEKGRVCAFEEMLDEICQPKPIWYATAAQCCEAFVLTMETP